MNEKIYAIMATSNFPYRQLFIKNAIASFLAQTYDNKKLIIVNHGDPIKDIPSSNVLQVQVNPRKVRSESNHGSSKKDHKVAVGLMRNMAMDMLPPDAVWMVWDDDDWNHPNRMKEQYEYLKNNDLDACAMLKQVKYSFLKNRAGVFHVTGELIHDTIGWLQTMMWKVKPEFRYGNTRRRSDALMFSKYEKKFKCKGWTAPPHYFLRFLHHDNLWKDQYFRHTWKHPGQENLSLEEAAYLKKILCSYGLSSIELKNLSNRLKGNRK